MLLIQQMLAAAVPLSEDHKPNRTDERQRIESAGGVVVWAGTWRVGGVLAVSRAFGKCPELCMSNACIQCTALQSRIRMFLLACI